MFRRVIACSFVIGWFLLLGIEFSEDIGLVKYSGPDMDQAVESTLASLGKAISISSDIPVLKAAANSLPSSYISVLPPVKLSFLFSPLSSTKLAESTPKIYRLHSVLLF